MRKIALGKSIFGQRDGSLSGDDAVDVAKSAINAIVGDLGLLNGAIHREPAKATTSSLPKTGTAALLINDTTDHVINAVESTSVSFSVSGISGGSTGAVTFTDSGDHHVVVAIQGNGTYSADLSSLTDGAITSSLSATNPSGSTTSATGNTVTLDTDRGLTPDVSVNALDPAHVTFTISGLEGDESGTMTFTDINGKQVVVDVGSNGDYSADLSSLAQGKVTYLVSETDPAGNAISFDPPFGLGDGSATAPAGTAQLPNLLSGYAVRAPWQVAGVDYHVGIAAGTTLKDPSTMNMAGVSVDKTNHVVYVTGDNVVLDGWNFRGWGVSIQSGADNTTVTNNDFAGGVLRYEPGSSNGTVMYNHFDQSGTVPNMAPFIAFGGGTFTVEYNDFENSYAMAAQFPVQTGAPQTIIFQYNLIVNAGTGSAAGAHGDWVQVFGDKVLDAQFNYNTVVQNNYASQGWSLEWTGQEFDNISVSNNTMITANGSTNYAFLFVKSYINGTATVANNYLDPRGLAYGVLVDNSNISGPFNGNIVTSNDVNMVTGAYIYPPTGGTGTTSTTAITSISTDSNVVGDHITNDNTLALSGAAPANSTVKVFDGSTQIGSTTATASGAWSYNTATLADGSHSFTISATSGGTTTTSAASIVTVDTKAPSAPTIASFSPDTGTVGDGVTTTNTLTLSGSAEANSTVKVFEGSTPIGTATANGSGTWSLTTGTLSNATHAFTAVAMDAAGNTSSASTALSVTVNAPAAPAAPAPPPAAANLVTNGSFETGDFTGWTLGGNYTGGQTYINNQSESGAYAAAIGSMGSDGTLSQTLQTTAGQQYTLSFWVANQGSGPNDFAVKWNGTTLSSTVNASAMGFTQATFTVTATGPTSTLEFDARQDPSHWSLDNISVTAIGTPAPSVPTITSFSPDTGVVGDGITDPAILTLTGTAVANSTVKVYDGTTLLGTATASASGAWSLTTAPLPDGVHRFTATDTVSGTTSAPSAVMTVTIDTTAPAAPTIASFSPDTGAIGDKITSANVLTLSGTAEANSTVKVFDGTTLLSSTVTNSSGAWTYTTSPLANGAHGLQATATDPAGNISVASAAMAVTVDTVAPNAPNITSFSPDTGTVGDGVTTANVLMLTGTAEANATVKVYDGTTLLGSVAANSSGAWTYTTAALANGAHSLTATATDVAGNTGATSSVLAVTITVAPSAPTITSFSPDTGVVGDGITDPAILTLTGTAVANSTLKVYDGTTLLGTATANASGAWSFTTVPLPDGLHSFTATDTVFGVTSTPSVAMSVTIDTVAPVAPTIASFSTDSGVVGDGITHDATLTLTGTAEANATVKVYDGTTFLGSVAANSSGAWTYTTAALANSAHSLTATATDPAGNISVASAAMAVTVDTVAPNAPVILSEAIVNTNEMMLTGTAESNGTVNVFEGTTLLGTVVADNTGAWSYTTNPLSAGAHAFTATVTDAASNTSPASTPVDPVIGAAIPSTPTILSFSPDSGVVGDGITNAKVLTLTGTADPNDAIKVYDGTTLLGSATASGNGAWSFVTTALANGSHSLSATAVDSTGDTSAASSAFNVTVDTVSPTTVFTGDVKNSNGSFTLSGSVVDNGLAGAGDLIKIYDGTTYLGSTTAGSNGQWSFTTAVLKNATHTFTTAASDQAGNVGNSTGAAIYGSTGKSTLVGTTGNDIMTGGSLSSDTFVFSGSNFGNDVITDFRAQGWSHDVIQFNKTAFSNFAAVLAHAAQVGHDVVITHDATDTVTLKNVTLSSLTQSDFHFI